MPLLAFLFRHGRRLKDDNMPLKICLLALEILTKDDHVKKLYAAVRANKTCVIVVKWKCLVNVDKRPK